MSRYIDAERIPNDKFFNGMSDKEKAKVLQWFLQSPTADVVEVVRCEDCKYAYRHPAQGFFRCSKIGVYEIMCSGSHFCSCGIKRSE